MFPRGFHPQKASTYQPGDILYSKEKLRIAPALPRTVSPPKYYFFDFGLSRKAEGRELDFISSVGRYGSIISVPEMNREAPHNSYDVDVYCLGVTIRELVLDVRIKSTNILANQSSAPSRDGFSQAFSQQIDLQGSPGSAQA